MQSVRGGQQVTDSFGYNVTDGLATSASVLTVTVTGSNDAPVATSDIASVSEDAVWQASGNVLANDTDIDQGTVLGVANAGTLAGEYGSLELAADGSYTYTLNNLAANVQALRAGVLVSDVFGYTVQDNDPEHKSANATLTVNVVGANDSPVANADTANVTEDASTMAMGNVLTNDRDPDLGQNLSVMAPGAFQGIYGSLVLGAEGAYTYALNSTAPSVQSLRAGQTVTENFAYSASDGLTSSPSSLIVTITGTNDAPGVTADTAAIVEDLSGQATGNVLTNDSDVDTGDTLAVLAPATFHGTFGDLVLTADGSYAYSLDNAAANVQSLRGGQTVTDGFSYSATDGLVSSASSLTLTITGTNDTPVAFADTATVTEDAFPTASGNVLANDQDPDIGDSLHVASATGTLYGSYGDLTLATDGSYSYALNNEAQAVQSLAGGQSVTDVFSYTVMDDGAQPLGSAATLSITIVGTNDAPLVVVPIATQAGRERQAFSFPVPVGTFTEIDNGDVLSYSATAVDAQGNLQPLPSWLSFNAATQKFVGTPGSMEGGSFDLVVSANDTAGASAFSRFTLNISDEFAGSGAYASQIMGNDCTNVLNGTNLNEVISGLAGSDTLFGGAGDDTLSGGFGADALYGDGDNDTLKFTTDAHWGHDDHVINAGESGETDDTENIEINKMNRSLDTFDGGAGTDTLLGTSGDDAIILDDGNQRIKNIEVIDAGAGDDVVDLTSDRYSLGDIAVYGGDGEDVIWSSTGNDLLYGGNGNDVLDGGAGSDRMTGGAGSDTYTVDNVADQIIEGVNDGSDEVYASVSYALAANVENLTLTDSADLSGAGNEFNNVILGNKGNNLLAGNAGSDTLIGQDGNDTLDGGSGVDVMRGGDGNDTYMVDNSRDQVIESGRGGTDLVNTSVSYSLGANVENLTLTGSAGIFAAGNSQNNRLVGNAGANMLFGGAGDDLLDGKAGNDILIGGTGEDTYLLGRGHGNDIIQENDKAKGNTDVAEFDVDVGADQLWFRKVSNNLEVSIIGTDDKFTVANWYLGSQYHVEQFKTSDGKTLLDSQVQNLVSAMAGFAPPVAGQTTLAANYATSLSPMIVANWQ